MRPISELPEHWQRWHQEWDAIVPQDKHKLHLQAELFGEREEQSYSAAFELFLFASFKSMRLKVDFQPEINGVNPDFCISDKRGCSAFVEAGAMFSDSSQKDSRFDSKRAEIWKEFKELRSEEFSVDRAYSSGNPGNVRAGSVRRRVQEWIDQLDAAEARQDRCYNILPSKTFEFKDWTLDIVLELKSPEDKERLGVTAVDKAGFGSGGLDGPAMRLKSKLKEKSSQVRKTYSHCIVAITEKSKGFSVDDVQTALLGGNFTYHVPSGKKMVESHPYIDNLDIPQPNTDGLWSPHNVKEPMAVIVHTGNLEIPNDGETELWLNPNSDYCRVPLPLFSLKIHSAQQKIWTRPATGL